MELTSILSSLEPWETYTYTLFSLSHFWHDKGWCKKKINQLSMSFWLPRDNLTSTFSVSFASCLISRLLYFSASVAMLNITDCQQYAKSFRSSPASHCDSRSPRVSNVIWFLCFRCTENHRMQFSCFLHDRFLPWLCVLGNFFLVTLCFFLCRTLEKVLC